MLPLGVACVSNPCMRAGTLRPSRRSPRGRPVSDRHPHGHRHLRRVVHGGGGSVQEPLPGGRRPDPRASRADAPERRLRRGRQQRQRPDRRARRERHGHRPPAMLTLLTNHTAQDRPRRDALRPARRGAGAARQRLQPRRLHRQGGPGHRRRRPPRVRRRLGRAAPVLPLADLLPVRHAEGRGSSTSRSPPPGNLQCRATIRASRTRSTRTRRSSTRRGGRARSTARRRSRPSSRPASAARRSPSRHFFHTLIDPNANPGLGDSRAAGQVWDRGPHRANFFARREFYSRFLIVSGGPDKTPGVPVFDPTYYSDLSQYYNGTARSNRASPERRQPSRSRARPRQADAQPVPAPYYSFAGRSSRSQRTELPASATRPRTRSARRATTTSRNHNHPGPRRSDPVMLAPRSRRPSGGFTLIELLVVVADRRSSSARWPCRR